MTIFPVQSLQRLDGLTGLNKDQDAQADLLKFLRPYRDEARILQATPFGEKRHIALQRIWCTMLLRSVALLLTI